MTERVNLCCNWTQVAGSELSELVPTRLFDGDVFVKPELDDLVQEEHAALFSTTDSFATSCELEFKISSCKKIAALSLVCSASKVECFIGASQEYYETIHGVDIEEDNADVPIKPYRYDIEVDRSGITEIKLKLLTSAKEICIYGVMLHIAPNPNGITTDLPWAMDLEHIKKLFQSANLNSSQSNTDVKTKNLQQFMSLMNAQTSQSTTHQQACGAGDSSNLYAHIDIKFKELESTICKRMDDFEAKQTEKLNKIIEMLEKRS